LKAIIIIIATFIALNTQAQKHEVRAVWLATIGGIDWPKSQNAATQKRELTNILDKLKQAGINTVLIQTRIRATTIYPSSFEPFDLCLTGKHGYSPGYDPLLFAVDECHRRGMECHAWMVTLPIGKTTEQRFKDFKKKHPKIVKTIGQDGFMDPEQPETGDYLASICAEVTQRYDVDGIHLDYIRYPENWKLRIPRHQARENITGIVRKIHHAVKTLKPWVKLSCSPIGKSGDLTRYRSGGWNAYNAVCQDAQGWLREGLMDQLYPMMYFKGNNYYPFALDWKERSYGRTIISGLGIYFLSPKEGNWTLGDVTREMSFSRQNGIGHCYFRSMFLTDNTRGIYDFARQFDEVPALIPPMTWISDKAPEAPTRLLVQRTESIDRVSWDNARNRSNSPYLLYNVYASTTPEIDTDEPRNLVATRHMGNSIHLPHRPGKQLYYAVTAVDRYGNESAPVSIKMRKPTKGHQRVALTPSDTRIPPFYYQMTKKQRKKLGL